MTITKQLIPSWKGVMLNGTSVIDALTKPEAEKMLFAYIKQFNITSIDMYGLSGVLGNKSNWRLLAVLNNKLRDAGITWISAQRGSAEKHLYDANISTLVFNAWCDNELERFNSMGIEGEPWQKDHTKSGYVPYGDWMKDISEVYAECVKQQMRCNVYVHDFVDTTTNVAGTTMVANLVASCHRIYLTCYVSTDQILKKGSTYKKVIERLKMIADAARKIGKIQYVVILINGKPESAESCSNYLDNHLPSELWNQIMVDAKAGIPNFKSLEIKGPTSYGLQENLRLVKIA